MKERHDPHFHLPVFAANLYQIARIPHKPLKLIFDQSTEIWDQASEGVTAEFPYIEISNVGLGTNEYEIDLTPVSDAPSRARMVVRAENIILSTTRPHRGAIAVIRPEDDMAIASTGFAVLRKKPEFTKEADTLFLFYALTSQMVLKQLLQRSSGGNYPAITGPELDKILIPLPLMDIQREMVKEMQAARTQCKHKFEEADALLSGMDASLLNSLGITTKRTMFPRFYAAKLKDAWGRCDPDYHSPKFKQLRAAIEGSGYPVYDVGTLAPNPRTGFAAGRQDQAFDEVEGIPHVRPLNITKHGELTFEGTKFVPRAAAGPDDILLNGEVLLNNTNSTEWVGKTTVFEGQCECCCSNHITRLNPVSSLVTPWFLASLLNAMRSTGYLGLLATNFVNQAGINTETLSSLRLPVPPLKKQEAIISELNDRRTIARRLRDEAAKEWDAAKARFGAKLIGTEAGNEPR
jgi:type I restriction enzyme, S subunit